MQRARQQQPNFPQPPMQPSPMPFNQKFMEPAQMRQFAPPQGNLPMPPQFQMNPQIPQMVNKFNA